MTEYQKGILRNLLTEDWVYCHSAHHAVSVNNVKDKPYFNGEVECWRDTFKGKPVNFVYQEIEKLAREFVLKENWEEYDVDGFSWYIGVFSLICESAGLVDSFDIAFKEAYKLYINKGLNS